MYSKLAAVMGSLVLTVLGLRWLLAGDTNPLDHEDRPFSSALTLYPDGWANGVFVTCAAIALLAALWLLQRPNRWVAGTGIVALLLLMDASSLMAAGYLPAVIFGAVTGKVDVSVFWTLGLLLQLTLLATVAAFGRHIIRHRRPTTSLEQATARTRRWTRIAIEAPLVYALTRVLMFFCVPGFDMFDFNEPILWAGLGLALSASAGAWLTFGLIRPWGEVFPRWLPGLRGKQVPIGLAVTPGLLVSVMILTAGRDVFASITVDTLTSWPLVVLPGFLWPLWAFALAMATVNYAARRRITPVSVPCRRSARGSGYRRTDPATPTTLPSAG